MGPKSLSSKCRSTSNSPWETSSAIITLARLRQGDYKFKTNLDYTVSSGQPEQLVKEYVHSVRGTPGSPSREQWQGWGDKANKTPLVCSTSFYKQKDENPVKLRTYFSYMTTKQLHNFATGKSEYFIISLKKKKNTNNKTIFSHFTCQSQLSLRAPAALPPNWPLLLSISLLTAESLECR